MPKDPESELEAWRAALPENSWANEQMTTYLDLRRALIALKTSVPPTDGMMEFVTPKIMKAALQREAFGLMVCSDAIPAFLISEVNIAARGCIHAKIVGGRYIDDPTLGLNQRIDVAAVAVRLGIWFQVRDAVRYA